MAELSIRVTDVEPAKSVLAATGAVVKKWEDMRCCYSSNEEAVQLADLLDTLSIAVRALDGERHWDDGHGDPEWSALGAALKALDGERS